MASQILNGSSNPTYTNNTGQNVRLILNVLRGVKSVSWAGVTADLTNFNQFTSNVSGNPATGLFKSVGNLTDKTPDISFRMSPPYQLTLAPGQTFSAVCNNYNIAVIKEDGS